MNATDFILLVGSSIAVGLGIVYLIEQALYRRYMRGDRQGPKLCPIFKMEDYRGNDNSGD